MRILIIGGGYVGLAQHRTISVQVWGLFLLAFMALITLHSQITQPMWGMVSYLMAWLFLLSRTDWLPVLTVQRTLLNYPHLKP